MTSERAAINQVGGVVTDAQVRHNDIHNTTGSHCTCAGDLTERFVDLASWIVARHTPTKIELEFFFTDGPSDFCSSSCNERDCEGHCEEVWCCTDCGDVADDGMSFSWTRWPCAHVLQVRLLAGDLVTIPNPNV